jgi:hypothetical protein
MPNLIIERLEIMAEVYYGTGGIVAQVGLCAVLAASF